MNPKETVYLVDSDDNILGTRPHDSLTNDDCWRDVAIWLENGTGTKVLLQLRSKTEEHSPNVWTCAVIGTVEYPELYLQTATREAYEEIGLSGCDLVSTGQRHAKHSFGYRVTHGFKAVCDWGIDDFTIQKNEVAKIEWVPKSQVLGELSGELPQTRPWSSTAKLWLDLFNLA
jgi:isopentenyldiphosphate isomerase